VSTRGFALAYRAADGAFRCSLQDCEKSVRDGNAMNSHFHPQRRQRYQEVELDIPSLTRCGHDIFWVLFQTMEMAVVDRLKEFIAAIKTNQGVHRFRIERMPEDHDVDNVVFIFWVYNAVLAWP